MGIIRMKPVIIIAIAKVYRSMILTNFEG